MFNLCKATLLASFLPSFAFAGGMGGGTPPAMIDKAIIIDPNLEFGSNVPLTIVGPRSGLTIVNPRLRQLEVSSDTMTKVMSAAIAKQPIYLNRGDDKLLPLKAESMDFLKNSINSSLESGQKLILKESAIELKTNKLLMNIGE